MLRWRCSGTCSLLRIAIHALQSARFGRFSRSGSQPGQRTEEVEFPGFSGDAVGGLSTGRCVNAFLYDDVRRLLHREHTITVDGTVPRVTVDPPIHPDTLFCLESCWTETQAILEDLAATDELRARVLATRAGVGRPALSV
jgi:hypothetical protein